MIKGILLVFYLTSLIVVTIYCLIQFHLLIKYKKKNVTETKHPREYNGDAPIVTVQLPIYNEYYVVDRLIDNICLLKYPKSKLEIQVLDDSTDETIERTRAKVKYYSEEGFDIKLIKRENREGYKAGALKYATKTAKGEYIAIFDADFLPNADFLTKTIPYFENEKVAVVQTKWGHINQDYSLLTRVQAFQLNVHFSIEQEGREKGNYLLQFNGTAGVWRKSAINDAGGWHADTLTEDLDLSYRAQLKGWQIVYLEDVTSPAELPAEMIGLKSQQYRWMKGGAETAKKLLPTVWNSNIGIAKKIHASTHLLGSSVFLFVFMIGVFSVPLGFLISPTASGYVFMNVFLISLFCISIVYFVANVESVWDNENKIKSVLKFLFLFPVFLSLSMGLSLHNSLAVISGYRGKKSPFVRTPKFNIKNQKDSYKQQKYQGKKLPLATILEGVLAIYFLGSVIFSFYSGRNSLIIFHTLLFFGYSTIFYFSVKHLNYQIKE